MTPHYTLTEAAEACAELVAERNELATQLAATQQEVDHLRGELDWVYRRLAEVLKGRQDKA